MAHTYNKRLLSKLPQDPQHFLVIDTAAFLNDLVANGPTYGFKHLANDEACREEDRDYCFPETLKGPEADQTYNFAAGVHLTPHANKLLADYVLEKVAASPLK